MNKVWISGLADRQQVNTLFLVQFKDVRQKKTGDPYLSLVLSDKTGEIDAKMWDNVQGVLDAFAKDDFVRVKGETQLYQNRLQLTVHAIARVDDSEVDLADFLPASKRDPEEMWSELMGRVNAMKNCDLQSLLLAVLNDPVIGPAYRRAPAAKGIHHAWLGGLLEHVLSLAALAEFTAAHYADIDADLLLTGVVLHDIGKIRELSYERSFSYSSDGQLLGHIVIALRILADKLAALPDFPPKLRMLVEHMVISHHGSLEYGSPKVPVFAEALLLHHLDNLDSKMEAMRAAVTRDAASDAEFTPYIPALERSVLNKQRYLNGPASAKPAPAPAPAPARKTSQSTLFGSALTSALKEDRS